MCYQGAFSYDTLLQPFFSIGEIKIVVLPLSSVEIERKRVPMMPVISGNFLVCGTIFFP
jgi:hypothetical protein